MSACCIHKNLVQGSQVSDNGGLRRQKRILRRIVSQWIHTPKEDYRMTARSTYSVIELVGTSSKSWEDAARNAVTAAARTLRDLRIAEVLGLDMIVRDGKPVTYRTRLKLSFKYHDDY